MSDWARHEGRGRGREGEALGLSLQCQGHPEVREKAKRL